MSNFLTPPKPIEQRPESEIDAAYKSQRLKVFIGIFVGYAAYYLVRKNFSLATNYLKDIGFDEGQLGFIFSFNALAYGISKFVMGGISDRSDARKFLPLGLILASIAVIISGTYFGMYNVAVMITLQFLIGWFGGMGWPPCGRVMTHWFSTKERGTKMSIWNVAHNVGGGLLGLVKNVGMSLAPYIGLSAISWQVGIFWMPAFIAILLALISYLLIRDNPQSCGLPSIEEYKNDYPPNYSADSEKVLTTKEIFFKYVLNNKILWFVAFANAFVYFARYGIQDWSPIYLKTVKHFDENSIGYAYAGYEWAAIPGTIICGWISDKVFKGKRAMTTIIFMLLVILSILVYWKSTDKTLVIIAYTAIGFFVYGPVMLIGVHALDLAPKNAAGTSAGLTGFFGYFVGTSLFSGIIMGRVVKNFGWDHIPFYLLIGGCVIAIILMAFTYKQEKKLETK